jgi:hypothetical protein
VAQVSTNAAKHPEYPPLGRGYQAGESLDEQVQRRGLRPINSAADLMVDGAFESDEELDEFLTDLYASRRANLA